MKKWLLPALGGLLVGVGIGYFAFSNPSDPYVYYTFAGTVNRTNKLTGVNEMSTEHGWVKAQ